LPFEFPIDIDFDIHPTIVAILRRKEALDHEQNSYYRYSRLGGNIEEDPD